MTGKKLGRRNTDLLQSSELDLASVCESMTHEMHDFLVSQASLPDQRS